MQTRSRVRRTLLYVAHTFPPRPAGGAIRAGQTAKYLSEFGWDPIVVTGRAALGETEWLDSSGSPVTVHRLGSLGRVARHRVLKHRVGAGRAINGVARWLSALVLFPDRHVVWAVAVARESVQVARAEECSLVLATMGPPSAGLLGYVVSRVLDLPLALDFRDLWADHPNRNEPTRIHRWLHRFVEQALVRRASLVVTVSERMRIYYAQRYPAQADKMVSIPNGYDPDLSPSQWGGTGKRTIAGEAPAARLRRGLSF